MAARETNVRKERAIDESSCGTEIQAARGIRARIPIKPGPTENVSQVTEAEPRVIA
jgi:hypothetical protein